MNNKIMLLALAALSAVLVVLPSVASATPAHISKAENFVVESNILSHLTRVDGTNLTCKRISGSGTFDAGSTTTGKVSLLFHECENSALKLPCTTAGQPAGTIAINNLPFHLITLPTEATMPKAGGVLITPAGVEKTAGKFQLAAFSCAGVPVEVIGNGIIGTLSPECGKKAKNWTLTFASAAAGTQTDLKWTGVTYDLESKFGAANHVTSSIDASATLKFGTEPELVCT